MKHFLMSFCCCSDEEELQYIFCLAALDSEQMRAILFGKVGNNIT